jgi:phosphoheptose isomerase
MSEIKKYLQSVVQATADLYTQEEAIDEAVKILFTAWAKNRLVYTIGNGGAAAQAAHSACDWMKWTSGDARLGLKVQSLLDMPIVSAVANDIGYHKIFRYQLGRLYRSSGDVVVAFSCSGGSDNIIEALHWAAGRFKTILITGNRDSPFIRRGITDVGIICEGEDYRVQEDLFSIVSHCIAGLLRAKIDVHVDK